MTPFLEWMMESIGNNFVGMALMSWISLSGASTNTAIGCALVPALVGSFKTVLNDLPGTFGMKKGGAYFNVGIHVFFALSPETGSQAWGVPSDPKTDFLLKSLGYFLT